MCNLLYEGTEWSREARKFSVRGPNVHCRASSIHEQRHIVRHDCISDIHSQRPRFDFGSTCMSKIDQLEACHHIILSANKPFVARRKVQPVERTWLCGQSIGDTTVNSEVKYPSYCTGSE